MAHEVTKKSLTRLRTMLAEGRIVRGEWRKTDTEGRDLSSLLAAYLPRWLTIINASSDDMSEAVWLKAIHRYADLADRWGVLDDAAWDRIKWRHLRRCMEIMLPHDVDGYSDHVFPLIDRQVAGDPPRPSEWRRQPSYVGWRFSSFRPSDLARRTARAPEVPWATVAAKEAWGKEVRDVAWAVMSAAASPKAHHRAALAATEAAKAAAEVACRMSAAVEAAESQAFSAYNKSIRQRSKLALAVFEAKEAAAAEMGATEWEEKVWERIFFGILDDIETAIGAAKIHTK